MWAARSITRKYNLEISVLDILKRLITWINSIKDWLDALMRWQFPRSGCGTGPLGSCCEEDGSSHRVQVSFSSSFSSLPSPWCENFRGCNADVLVRISKTSIDQEEAVCLTVTLLDLCVFPPHWSASERKWEGECESHFKHLLWVWSIPKVQVSTFWR